MNSGPLQTDSIEIAAEQLLKGNLVAVPTETVYGLAAVATNLDAVARVFELKGRPLDHPLIVHCGSADQAWKFSRDVSHSAKNLADAFWPGPITLVVPKNEHIDLRITGGQNSVALRVPSHPLTLELLRKLDCPLVAPSANRFGRVSPTTADHVADEFPGKDLTILDGGHCPVGIESTIVDCRSDQEIQILRPGKITEDDIATVLGGTAEFNDSKSAETVRVSGSLPSHYSPDAKVILLERDDVEQWLEKNKSARKTMLISGENFSDTQQCEIAWQVVSSDVERFAREIYGLLRVADQKGFETVVVELPRAAGIGIAVRDRLHRAAAKQA